MRRKSTLLLSLFFAACAEPPAAPHAVATRSADATEFADHAGAGDLSDALRPDGARVCQVQRDGGGAEVAARGPRRLALLAAGSYETRLFVDPTKPPIAGLRFRRLTDAVDAARASRLARGELTRAACRIHIAVAAGDYVGSFDAAAPATHERLPILIDVPDLTIRGATHLGRDEAGRPVPPADGAPASVLRPDRPMVFLPVTEAFLVVVGHPGGSAGDGAEIRDVTFASGRTDGSSGGMGVITLRVRRLRLEGNHFPGGLSSAFDVRASDGVIVGNLMQRLGANCAVCTAGPGHLRIRDNRIEDGALGGIYVGALLAHMPIAAGAAPAAAIEPYALPATASAEAEVVNNRVTGHRRLPIGFALRVLALGPGTAGVPQATTVRVRRNDFDSNTFGIVVDGGFPAAGALRRGDLTVRLAHNRIAGSCHAPLLVAFTRHTGALGVTVNPYLVNSTFALALGGDVAWADAWYAHPDGLGNTLLVDGVLQPTGTRVAYDPARSCP